MPSDLDRYSVAVIVLFALSICFVISPVSHRLPWRWARWGKNNDRHIRIRIGVLEAPLIAVLILWASQAIDKTVVRDGIVGVEGIKPYNILILFFSLAYMAITLDISGVLQAAAFWVSNKGGHSGWRLYLYFYLMLTAFSIVVGNDPIILSGTVFLVYWTDATHVDSVAWLYAEFAAANTASMVLFVGNPTNVVICEGFGIRNIAYTAYTVFPFIACSIVCYGALALQFRKSKYVPKIMPTIGHLDPRTVLTDPVGAVVGSVILGGCLATLLGVSFTHIDVWQITLPFAVAKFIWDLAWDYWRFLHRSSDDVPVADADQLVKAQLKRAETQGSTLVHHGRPADAEKARHTHPPASEIGPDGNPVPQPPQELDISIYSKRSTLEATPDAVPSAQSSEPLTPQPPVSSSPGRIAEFKLGFRRRFPTFATALPRLPFALVPFAFCQFILVEALAHRGWIRVFSRWLVLATDGEPYTIVWLVGVLGVILCNISGTNIGATILLTKVIRAAGMGTRATLAGAIALAVSSNIGAVSFVFSASLAGLLWRTILDQKGHKMRQLQFAKWNLLPLIVMTVAGLGVGCAEMAVIIRAGLAGTGEEEAMS